MRARPSRHDRLGLYLKVAKTIAGRVVYNRPVHLFTYSDVLRVVRAVEIPKDPTNIVRALGAASAALLAIQADIIRGIRNALPANRFTIASRMILTTWGFMADLASSVPEFVGSTLQDVLDSLLSIGGQNGESSEPEGRLQ